MSVLDIHAPLIVFQDRKNYLPWLTEDTVNLIKDRDRKKSEAKNLAMLDGNRVSIEQRNLWAEFEKLRNKQSLGSC